jgi:putative RecB family exonuclease
MRVYSNSRLWLFENCPEAFKIKYVDKLYPDIPKSINLFLGSMAHESLEWLYHKVKNSWNVDMDDLIRHFANNWRQQFSHDLVVKNGDADDYFNKGIKFLIDYYKKNHPFSDNTIDIEKRIYFPLDDERAIQGFIDRIALNKGGEYEVHDYKTNAMMKKQEEVDADRQLAFYHIGLQKLYGKDVKIKLIWHFLAHNKTIVSRRTQEELDSLKRETLELIKKIESNTEWPACGKGWCDWCEYKRVNGLVVKNTDPMNIEKNGDLGKFI